MPLEKRQLYAHIFHLSHIFHGPHCYSLLSTKTVCRNKGKTDENTISLPAKFSTIGLNIEKRMLKINKLNKITCIYTICGSHNVKVYARKNM